MGLTLATLVFFGVVLVWVLLPFLPGLREVVARTDAEPLRVVRDSEVDVRRFARGFRAYLQTHLSAELARCRNGQASLGGTLPDGSAYLILGRADARRDRLAGLEVRPCRTVVLACDDLRLPDEAVFLLELYAAGHVAGGVRSVFRAVLADGDIVFARRSIVLRWVHASGSVQAAAECELYGRVSADREIRIEPGSEFERLNAPRIVFGQPRPAPGPPMPTYALAPGDLLHMADVAAGRWLIDGDLEFPPGTSAEADLVVTGRARIGDGARITGSIKSRHELILGRGVQVLGSVVSERDMRVGEGCRIHGPLISERAVTIEPGCVLGTVGQPTTVSAGVILIASGTTVHGTVWAHARGEVTASGAEAPAARAPATAAGAAT